MGRSRVAGGALTCWLGARMPPAARLFWTRWCLRPDPFEASPCSGPSSLILRLCRFCFYVLWSSLLLFCDCSPSLVLIYSTLLSNDSLSLSAVSPEESSLLSELATCFPLKETLRRRVRLGEILSLRGIGKELAELQ